MRRSLLLVLFAAVALVSCASSEDPEDAQTILDRGFATDMRSADLEIEAEVELKGSSSFGRPVIVQARGPYISADGELPSTAIDIEVGSEGNGQTVSTGLLTTGDRAFIKFEDVYYEQPPREVRRASRLLRESRGRESSLSELGFNPRNWSSGATNEGDAEVDGVETQHVSGSLDVRSLMRDLNSFLRRSASAVGDATGETPSPLSANQIGTISESVEDPSFDVYVGKQDRIIRRVSARIEFEIPKTSRAGLGGIDGGSIKFSVQFSDVNGDQEVEAPANARPVSELTRSLGGGSIIEGLGGAGDDGGRPEPDAPAPESPSPGGGDGLAPDSQAFENYADCLDEARPEDTEALQRCSDLLQQP